MPSGYEGVESGEGCRAVSDPYDAPNVVEVNFGHGSNVRKCDVCGGVWHFLHLDGSISCGTPECFAPTNMRYQHADDDGDLIA